MKILVLKICAKKQQTEKSNLSFQTLGLLGTCQSKLELPFDWQLIAVPPATQDSLSLDMGWCFTQHKRKPADWCCT